MAFAASDLLEMDGQRVLAEPWTARRKRLAEAQPVTTAAIRMSVTSRIMEEVLFSAAARDK